jgi:hypothetical protein
MASFTMARCLDLGRGTPKDPELAKKFYKRVSHSTFFLSLYLDFETLFIVITIQELSFRSGFVPALSESCNSSKNLTSSTREINREY